MLLAELRSCGAAVLSVHRIKNKQDDAAFSVGATSLKA